MKDQQGVERINCDEGDCLCVEYVRPTKGTDNKCDYCGHLPVKHRLKNPPPKKIEPARTEPNGKEEESEDSEEFEKPEEDDTVYTPANVPKPKTSAAAPQVAHRSEPAKKKSILDDIKNPKQFIKDKRKKKKD
eukprot:TRINITY_DN13951_c1_g1_i1.p2 TRINITY_DN13951_c1_g1~~TRINITY_DN13951_c1_g1_i1.p2  ORF type:complete len:133 (-),score=34.73 TRINITY_DN13951_c1_g1_i1:194-592(-)